MQYSRLWASTAIELRRLRKVVKSINKTDDLPLYPVISSNHYYTLFFDVVPTLGQYHSL